MRRYLAFALLACCACDLVAPVSGPPPIGAVPLTLPASYPAWWRAMEHCSGKTRPMRELTWYSVPGATFNFRGHDWLAVYVPRYAVAIAEPEVGDGVTVRLVMLKALEADTAGCRAAIEGRE